MKKFLFFIAIVFALSVSAQFSREQAVEILIEEVVGQDSLSFHHFYSKIEMMYQGDTLWGDNWVNYQISPYLENWVFFVDDAPPANWAHPCRWIFFDAQNGAYIVIHDNWPPMNFLNNHVLYLLDWEWILGTGAFQQVSCIQEFLVYPNPVYNKLFFAPLFPPLSGYAGGYKIHISDILGNTILEEDFTFSEKKITLNLSGINAGIYFLSITQNGKILFYQKVLKH